MFGVTLFAFPISPSYSLRLEIARRTVASEQSCRTKKDSFIQSASATASVLIAMLEPIATVKMHLLHKAPR